MTSPPSTVTMTSAVRESEKYKQLEQYRVRPEDYTRGSAAAAGCPFLTTQHGLRIANDDSSLRATARGPLLMEDFHFREKITHFDHERIPERVVHARGSAAHGFFVAYSKDAAKYTAAKVLTDPSRVTPVFVRFSTVLGSRGSPDTVRDVRGFATRFYTDEGNWDIVGNNIPVFFIQDAVKFPDLIHAGKPEPHNEIPQAQTAHDNFWDFISLMPESSHMMMWVMSDRAIPRSYRMMQGFGVNTFIFTNDAGQRSFVKFHWKPKLGVHSLVWDECLKINGTDPDFHRRDLFDAIETGAYPEYELGVQVIPEADEDKFDFDLLDCTKLVPEELVPIEYIGRMVLNRNPSEFFTETEQVAFCTQHVVPGIGFSDDPMLQGRNFSYFDTQLTRLGGPNFNEIPINRPRCPVLNNERDGLMRQTINPGRINYWPNRHVLLKPANDDGAYDRNKLTDEPEHDLAFADKQKAAARNHAYLFYEEKLNGIKTRMRGPKFQEHYNQARMFYHSLTPVEQRHLMASFIFELSHCDDQSIRQRITDRLSRIDLNLAKTVAVAIGVNAPADHTKSATKISAAHPSPHKSPPLSQSAYMAPSIQSRKIAFLVADGYDPVSFAAIRASLSSAGAVPYAIGMRRGIIKSSAIAADSQPTSESWFNGNAVNSVFTIFNSKSVLFDATVVIGGPNSIQTLSGQGAAVAWIAESFKHYKAIFAVAEGIQLLQAAQLPLLANIKLASDKDGLTTVESQGVVSVHRWQSSPLPERQATAEGKEIKEEKEAGGAMGTVSEAASRVGSAVAGAAGAAASVMVGLVGRAAGAEAAEAVAKYLANESTGKFIALAGQHRIWDRETDKIPA